MELLSVFVFAIALSMDGLGAGIVYGMRKIKVPITSLLVIGFASSTAIGLSMTFGNLVARYVSIKIAEIAGAFILIIMGLRIIIQVSGMNRKKMGEQSEEKSLGEVSEGFCGESQETDEEEENQDLTQVIYLKIKFLGLVIQILREPSIADIDKSGHISMQEALLLSLALAMDAMVAGFGAAMAGFKPFITPFIVGPVSALCVSMGVYLGRNFAPKWLGEKAAALPGWMLILLGVARVMKI